jgi:cephalosporin-C deacetylase
MSKFFNIYATIVFICVSLTNLFAQYQLTNTLKLTATKYDHLFSKDTIPSFVLKIDAIKNTNARLEIKIKAITEDNFFDVSDEKLKLEKGTTTYNIFPKYKWWSNFYEIFARLATKNNEVFSDTITFAYNSDSIYYYRTKPLDFDNFWEHTFSILDSIPPTYKYQEITEKTRDTAKVFKLTYTSIDSVQIKAWFCLPLTDKPVPGILILPSYGNKPIPIPYKLTSLGFAVVAIQIHGLDVENDNYPIGDDLSASFNLDDPNKYYLRNAVAHAKRAIDFLFTRPEVDTSKIAVIGTSQGGGLALLLSGLDKRIKFTEATIPSLCCFEKGIESGCCARVTHVYKKNLIPKIIALSTLSYFDVNNLVDNLLIPSYFSVHLKDRISPPNTVFAIYNRVKNPEKHIIVYPNLQHQFPADHWDLPYEWLKKYFISNKTNCN